MKDWILQVFKAVGWSTRQWMFFLIVVSLFAVLIFIALLGQKAVNDLLIALTGLVVLVYTIETQSLRMEVVRQNEIALKPFVIIGIHRKKWFNRIYLKNIGKGAALFVRIEDVALGKVVGDLADLRERVVGDIATFSQFNYIESGEETDFQALCATNPMAGSIKVDFLPSIDPDTAQDNYELTIHYQNVEGRAYQTKMRIGNDGIALLNP
jgi:hypothetical protein